MARAEGRTLPRPVRWASRNWPFPFVGVVAFLARLVPVLRGAGLRGNAGLDPSVYYAATIAFVHGLLPYRDFLLLHPPGSLVLLAPFALIGDVTSDATGLMLARLAMMVLGAATAVMVALMLRKLGTAAVLIGGLTYAVNWSALYVERATWLEGLGSVLTILGMVLVYRLIRDDLTRPRLAALVAGIPLGLACTVKLWSVVMLAIALVWLLAHRRWIQAGFVALGSGGIGILVMAPYVGQVELFWRMTVSSQLTRPSDSVLVGFDRIPQILGLRQSWSRPDAWDWTLAALLAVVIIFALRQQVGRFAVLFLIGGGALLLRTSLWTKHYPALVAAPLAVVLGAGAAEILGLLRSVGWRRAVAAVAVAGIGFLAVGEMQGRAFTVFSSAKLRTMAAAHPGCVTTDDPGILISASLLSSNLNRGCVFVADLTGYRYYLGGADALADNTAWQQVYRDYMGSGTLAVLLRKNARVEMDDQTRAMVDGWTLIGKVNNRPVYLVR